MTEDRNDDSQKRFPEDAPTWTIPDHRDRTGVNRRTIITGAAWSIPVIALAVATPLAAASAAAPTLEFTNGPYEVAGCAPLGEVILNLTTDGNTPDPGKIVTVVLPAGLTWSDGTSGAKVFTATDASGNISIPAGQIIGSTSGNHVITATASTGATASVPVTVGENLVAKDWNSSQGYIATFANPAATAIGWNFFLGPDGTLYHGDSVIASNVSSAVGAIQGEAATGISDGVAYVDENGVAQVWSWNPDGGVVTSSALPAVPTGSTVVGWNSFLAPNGDLYLGNELVDSGVTSAVADQIGGPNDSVTYVSNGQAKIYFVASANPTTPTRSTFSNVPTGATAVGHNFLLAPNGDLYHSGGELVASGVTAAVGDQLGDAASGHSDGVSFVQNGVAMSWQWFPLGSQPPISTTFASVPAGSTPVGWGFFLAPGGGLYHGNDLIASNVVSAVGREYVPAGVDGITYVENVAC